jgi:thioredoxin-related protein
MKTRYIAILVVVLLGSVGLVSSLLDRGDSDGAGTGEPSISWHSFDEGVALASQTGKKLLIDVYTDWCSWCKKMDREVYPDKRVREVLEARFVAVKLDAESSDRVTFNGSTLSEAELARAMGVSGYPTTVFLDANAKPITKIAGYMQSKDFANALRFIGEDHYRTTTYDEFLSKQGALNSE